MKQVLLVMSVVACMFFYGCAGCANDMKHLKSGFVGLNRHIVLYNANGGIIKEWRTKAQVEDKGGTCYFIVDDKAITVSGSFIIEEE